MITTPLTEYADMKLRELCKTVGESIHSINDLHDTVMAQVERPLIYNVLRAVRWNQVHASQVLGINRNTLRKKVKLYNIHKGEFQ